MKLARLTVLVAVMALLWGASPVVAEDPATGLRRVLQELAKLEQSIKAARTEASAVGQQVAAAQAALNQALAAYNEAKALVDEAVGKVSETEADVAELAAQLSGFQADLARTEIDLANTKVKLEAHAVAMYMEATAVPTVDLFSQHDVADAATALAYTGAVFDEADDVFDAFQLLRREEERQRQAIAERKSQAEVLLAQLEAQKANLEVEQDAANAALVTATARAREVQALLDRIRHDIAAAEEHKDGLEADAERLEDEIARLQSTTGNAPGLLSWPVNGLVSSPFGIRVHPILGVKKLHTGIDINAASGTPIAASADGKVILAQSYGGYGNAVVVDHGGGMATLYAHQSKMAVRVGEVVTRGQVIGYSGCTGSCTGPHLHFEVRIKGVPVDPMQYLA